ncbi:MAG: hypothetical protein M3R17_00005, partial [Bacteroidota bacterium]|nr:hypothetical protein [Bacteroidota bacterium]
EMNCLNSLMVCFEVSLFMAFVFLVELYFLSSFSFELIFFSRKILTTKFRQQNSRCVIGGGEPVSLFT